MYRIGLLLISSSNGFLENVAVFLDWMVHCKWQVRLDRAIKMVGLQNMNRESTDSGSYEAVCVLGGGGGKLSMCFATNTRKKISWQNRRFRWGMRRFSFGCYGTLPVHYSDYAPSTTVTTLPFPARLNTACAGIAALSDHVF